MKALQSEITELLYQRQESGGQGAGDGAEVAQLQGEVARLEQELAKGGHRDSNCRIEAHMAGTNLTLVRSQNELNAIRRADKLEQMVTQMDITISRLQAQLAKERSSFIAPSCPRDAGSSNISTRTTTAEILLLQEMEASLEQSERARAEAEEARDKAERHMLKVTNDIQPRCTRCDELQQKSQNQGEMKSEAADWRAKDCISHSEGSNGSDQELRTRAIDAEQRASVVESTLVRLMNEQLMLRQAAKAAEDRAESAEDLVRTRDEPNAIRKPSEQGLQLAYQLDRNKGLLQEKAAPVQVSQRSASPQTALRVNGHIVRPVEAPREEHNDEVSNMLLYSL